MLALNILIFIVSCLALAFSGKWLIGALAGVARFFGWREFVVAFVIMSFASSIPNLFLGISSALAGIPELAFGDIVGGNVVDMTLVVALAAFLSQKGLPAESKMVQNSAVFTMFIAVLPLLLIWDGNLSKVDGVILIGSFFLYLFWLFSKQERFSKNYNHAKNCGLLEKLRNFLKDIFIILLSVAVLILASQGIMMSSFYFAKAFNFPLFMIGILIVGLGNAMPETYFSILSARKGQCWMILGNLMGSVVVAATLVLGIVVLIRPVVITDFSSLFVARLFLIVSALFFFFFLRSGQKITRKEAVILFLIYIIFVLSEIFVK